MNRLTVGRRRNNRSEKEILKKRFADFLMIIGTAAMCVSLTVPLAGRDNITREDAVAVMSSVSDVRETDREELVMPERDISANTYDTSIFEYIGEFFADLIREGIS